jgi:hypothetical protein
MREISELTMLLRGRVEVPGDLSLVTEEFQEGWSFVQSGDTHWLNKEIRLRGWHFMWIGEGSRRGGVGQTSQEAIAGALKLALRRVGDCFNAAEIESIEVKKYPWFVVAKVKVYPYQIQESGVLSSFDQRVPMVIASPAKAIAISGNQVAPAA